jgi:biotin carboxyl carrier protein
VEVLRVRFRLQIDGTEHRVTAGADGTITVDDDRFEAKVTAPSPDRRLIQLGAKTYEVRVVEEQSDPRSYVVEVAGERIRLLVGDVSRGGAGVGAAAAASPAGARGVTETANGGIAAPMPGRVARLLVEVGQGVEAGQVMLVLEAMKMENELRAPRKGVVKSILVREGDPVETGKRLIELE